MENSASPLDFRLVLISSERKLCPALLIWNERGFVFLSPPCLGRTLTHSDGTCSPAPWLCPVRSLPSKQLLPPRQDLLSQTSSAFPRPFFLSLSIFCRGVLGDVTWPGAPTAVFFFAVFKAAGRPPSEFQCSLGALQD